jgi:Beta-lactamase enzyme family
VRSRRPSLRLLLPIALGGLLVAAGAVGGIVVGGTALSRSVTVTATIPVTVTSVAGASRGSPHAPVPVTTVPGRDALARARRWLRGRDGRVAFAVIDGAGRLKGTRLHETFASASLVKAMLLVAFLQQLDRAQRPLDAADRALLDPMIRSSDNDAASAIFERVGQQGLAELALQAGMTDFTTSPKWGETSVSAADQARFFALLDQLLPRRSARLARTLLLGIVPAQTWGIPTVAHAGGYRVLFKGGWRDDILNQAARLEGPRATFSLAVLSDDNPSMAYGIETVEGVASALLGRWSREGR